ncbi:hypothetical protein PYW08_010075 [Mythimna loreyi]|uniref:Uncharacterized protein n=1 Tax=Mythimna loreyi TaxID=667449 RepID=A0ACC2Q5B2_9NEOP|nr:hypothetical protein PYW08_010075 [Mythimna loreyi]
MDTEKVILEVKTRECLWNPRHEQYKNKMAKCKAWEAVAEAVLPTYGTCNEHEQNRIVRAVQSRWKTARDAYMKCRPTETKKSAYKSRHHSYIYQEHLRFLEQVKDIDEGRAKNEDDTSNSFTSDNTTVQSNFAVSDNDSGDTSDEVMDFDVEIRDDIKIKSEEEENAIKVLNVKTIKDEQQNSLPGTSSQSNNQRVSEATVQKPYTPRKRLLTPRKAKSKMTDFETRLLNAVRLKINPGPNTSALQADDQFFFNSLAPLINNFDIHQKLKFRSKILEVVMEVGNVVPSNVKQEYNTYVYEEMNNDNS